MKLQTLIQALEAYEWQGPEPLKQGLVKGLTADTRQLQAGYLFAALRGTKQDGHHYLEQAAAAGAVYFLVEQWPEVLHPNLGYLKVESTAEALGHLAAAWHGQPSEDLYLVGVTGTNGKTTVASLLFQLFQTLGYPCGLISTIAYHVDKQVYPSTHTTPDALQLQALLAEMRAKGCQYVFMEVSSHAIDQRRIAGARFRAGIFTNLSHDHLDYHGSFAAYLQAKKRFFDDLPADAFALSNLDDRRGRVMLQNTKAKKYYYALHSPADFHVRIMDRSPQGMILSLAGREFHTRLLGDFNAYNLLAVYATAQRLAAISEEELLAALSSLGPAQGRFECLTWTARKVMAVVDYAHTPDALAQTLAALKDLRGQGRIWTLIGCGGDRDRAKRPLMARAACQYSDFVILTSDNPRSEDPLAILEEMWQGVPLHRQKQVQIEPDRRLALALASRQAVAGDWILVAGKGHETYQEIKGTRFPFDDRLELETLWQRLDSEFQS